MSDVELKGQATRLVSRKISEKTAELFKPTRMDKFYATITMMDGKLTGAKVRTKNKDFRCEGEVKTLFGMQNFRHKTTKKTTKLVIVEGEMDAMSVWSHNQIGMSSLFQMVHRLQRKLSSTTMSGSTTTTKS